MHFAWPSLDQAEQYCIHSTKFASCLFTQYLAFSLAFTIYDFVNGRMSDWLNIRQTLFNVADYVR